MLKANIRMRFRELRETHWKNLSVEGWAKATQSIVDIFVPKEISTTKRDSTAVGARGDIRWRKSYMSAIPSFIARSISVREPIDGAFGNLIPCLVHLSLSCIRGSTRGS